MTEGIGHQPDCGNVGCRTCYPSAPDPILLLVAIAAGDAVKELSHHGAFGVARNVLERLDAKGYEVVRRG